MNDVYYSPDGKINKVIIKKGNGDSKPTESCECCINICKISDESIDIKKFNSTQVVIGDVDTAFGRVLDKCLQTMESEEVAEVKFNLQKPVTFTLELRSFQLKRLICEWTVKEKYDLAAYHKGRGVCLFNVDVTDASHHFCKAIKMLASIPLEVDPMPLFIDGVEVEEINRLKLNLYNNLSSCYLRSKEYANVIYLCEKVLREDGENEKAFYKIGVAYSEVRDYDKAIEAFTKLLSIDPDNKPALDKLKSAKAKLQQESLKVKELAQKMFGPSGVYK